MLDNINDNNISWGKVSVRLSSLENEKVVSMLNGRQIRRVNFISSCVYPQEQRNAMASTVLNLLSSSAQSSASLSADPKIGKDHFAFVAKAREKEKAEDVSNADLNTRLAVLNDKLGFPALAKQIDPLKEQVEDPHLQIAQEPIFKLKSEEAPVQSPRENDSLLVGPKQELSHAPQNSPFNYGDLSREEAEAKLQNQRVGTGLLRYSSHKNDFVISYRSHGKVNHTFLGKKSLEQVVKEASVEICLLSPKIPDSPFYQEGLLRIDADNKLKNQPEGVGLLRRSTTQNDFAISYKSKGKVKHALLAGRSLEQAMQDLKINRFLLPEPLVSSPQSLPKQAFKKYDRQLILNLGSGRSAAGLSAKASKKSLSSETIDLREPSHSLAPLSALSASSRLYIIGHCSPGLDYIESDDGKKITVDEYVAMLVSQAPHLVGNPSKQKIKISLVACYAGVNKDEKKSFGYRLSRALDKVGIQAEVLARTSYVSRWQGKPEEYKKFVAGKHQAAGSKVVFTTTNGRTSARAFCYGNS